MKSEKEIRKEEIWMRWYWIDSILRFEIEELKNLNYLIFMLYNIIFQLSFSFSLSVKAVFLRKGVGKLSMML